MQNQQFYVAGPPTSLQFYPCFTPPPPQPQCFQMYPNNNGLPYNDPFQGVIGEGDVSSVVLPDGTVQLFFVPAVKFGNCNYCYNNSQTINGSWLIRSVNNPSILPPTPPAWQQNNRMALPPPCAPLCPGCQNKTNQGLKFHNDQCTSTVDIRLFCSGSQQRYDEEQRPHKPHCEGVVCNAPRKCSPDCVGIRNPERNPSSERYPERNDTNMFIDEPEPRRGKKRNRKEYCECVSDCSIHCQGKRKRRRFVRSSSSSSAEKTRLGRLKRWSREKAIKKQSKKLEKERRARDHRKDVIYEKYRRQSDSDMSIDEYKGRSKCSHCQRPRRSSSSGSLERRPERNDSCSSVDRELRHSRSNCSVALSYKERERMRQDSERKKEKKIGIGRIKNIITKTRRQKTDTSTCTNDKDPEQQKCDKQCGQQANEPAADTCPQAGPSLLSKLSSALSNFIYSPCNSQCSTCTSNSCCSELKDGVYDEVYDSNKGWRKTGRKQKRMDAKRKRYAKELIERNRRERRQSGNNEIEFLKQYSPSRFRKNVCTCNLPACCTSKDAESKLRSACASPRWNTKSGSPNFSPASSQYGLPDQYAKTQKKKRKSSCPRNVNARDCNNQYGNMDTNSKTNCNCPPTIQTGGAWLSLGNTEAKQKTRSDCACPPSSSYGKDDTNTKQKTRSDLARPPKNLSNQGSYGSASRNDLYNQNSIGDKTTNDSAVGRDYLNDYSKGDKTASPRAGSDYARRSPSNQTYSKMKCACSGMSIDTKNISREPDAVCKMGTLDITEFPSSDVGAYSNSPNKSGDEPDAVCKTGTLKIIDISEFPSSDVGAYYNSPNMSTRDTCAVSKDSLRNIGVLCEGPAIVDKCSATDNGSIPGIIANVMDMLGIGAGSSRRSPDSPRSQSLPRSPPPPVPAPAPVPAPVCSADCLGECSSTSFRLLAGARSLSGDRELSLLLNCGPYLPRSSPSCNPL